MRTENINSLTGSDRLKHLEERNLYGLPFMVAEEFNIKRFAEIGISEVSTTTQLITPMMGELDSLQSETRLSEKW